MNETTDVVDPLQHIIELMTLLYVATDLTTYVDHYKTIVTSIILIHYQNVLTV
jgi:hypothetical protein